MSEIGYYNMDGERITASEANSLFGDPEKITVDRTHLPGGLEVSTVLLVINHNFWGGGRPIIFESMVFGSDEIDEQVRYHTKEEAQEGHNRLVTKWTGWTEGDPMPEEEES